MLLQVNFNETDSANLADLQKKAGLRTKSEALRFAIKFSSERFLQ